MSRPEQPYWEGAPEGRWSNAIEFALAALEDDGAPEVVLAPLRVARYAARGLLRRRREQESSVVFENRGAVGPCEVVQLRVPLDKP